MEGTPPVHSGSGYGTHTRELYPCSIKSKDFSGHDVTIDNNIKPLTYDHDIDAPCGNSQSISRQPSVPERKVSTLPKQMVLKQPKTVGLTFRSGSTYSFSSFRPSFRSSFTRARSATQGTRHYEESRRQYNQLEASRFYGLDVEKHAGIGISLVWIKFNLDFKDEACILSALNSSIAVQQAIEIDQEVIQRINPTFELNNPRAPAPCYNIDILFAYINKSCNLRAVGFHFNRPDINGLIDINNIISLVQKDCDFIGILLRVGPISATSGAIAVIKKGEMFKFFTHQSGESLVSSDSLSEFFEKLSKKTVMMNYKHVCLFEVNPVSPKVFSRNRISGGSGGMADKPGLMQPDRSQPVVIEKKI